MQRSLSARPLAWAEPRRLHTHLVIQHREIRDPVLRAVLNGLTFGKERHPSPRSLGKTQSPLKQAPSYFVSSKGLGLGVQMSLGLRPTGPHPWGAGFPLHPPLPRLFQASGGGGGTAMCRVEKLFAELSFSEETDMLSYFSLTKVQHRTGRKRFRLFFFFFFEG